MAQEGNPFKVLIIYYYQDRYQKIHIGRSTQSGRAKCIQAKFLPV